MTVTALQTLSVPPGPFSKSWSRAIGKRQGTNKTARKFDCDHRHTIHLVSKCCNRRCNQCDFEGSPATKFSRRAAAAAGQIPRAGMKEFWGSKVLPNATPSETCMPHRLKITQATLDPEGIKQLKEGTRVYLYGCLKVRGPKGAEERQRFIITTFKVGQKETSSVSISFDPSTLVSFQVSS